MALIEFTSKGLCCPQGQFYIDPWKPVPRALITHAHSDHARPGHGSYLCHRLTLPLIQMRFGNISHQSVEWEETVFINGVKVSFHPAGHMIGSSQIRLEYQGEVWVVSGDYKTEDDGISGAFEPLRCHTFITECTFGLPIYNWKPQSQIFQDIRDWICKNHEQKKTSVLIAYSLGKSQRLLPCVSAVATDIFVHGAVWNAHQTLAHSGVQLADVKLAGDQFSREDYRGSVVIAPSGAESSPWLKRFPDVAVGICSGWTQVRGHVRRLNADAGFPLSDHADWKGLLQAVKATGAQKVFATHGFQAAFSRYLSETGIEAAEVKTEYGDEEIPEAVTEQPRPEL
ncbi:MAG TPA: ligase-associated DNA damage response exonuclease [Chitinophagaceae bacterium]|nr:ligase-associated DNA damage response exonuclease [Chitinophagaceae bacterium]